MFDTFGKLARLSPAERATIASGQFAGEYTPDALLDQMRTLAQFDASNDSTRTRLKAGIGVAVVGVVVCLFLHGFNPALMYGLAALFGVGVVACWVMLHRLTNVDIANNFRDVALPFLALLKQDMEPDAPVNVRIDLRAATHDKKRKGAAVTRQVEGYKKVVDTTYRDAWFHGSARLADGALLRWDVCDYIVQSARTKRSRSNKLETKTRHVKRSVIALALTVPNKRYGVDPTPSAQPGKVAVQGGAKRSTIKLVRKVKNKSLDPLDPRALIDTVSSAYQRLAAPARRAA